MTKPITKKPVPYAPYTATEQGAQRSNVQSVIDSGDDLANHPGLAYDVPHWIATLDAYREVADKRVVQAATAGAEAGVKIAADWIKAHGSGGLAKQMLDEIKPLVFENIGTEDCVLCQNTGIAKTSEGEPMGCPVYNEAWHRRTT